MGKQRKQRKYSTQKPYGRQTRLQTAERVLAPYSPPASISASGGSHVCAQTLSQNKISGPVTINTRVFVAVKQNDSAPVSEHTPLAQAFTDGEDFSKTVLRTPENLEKKTQTNQSPHKSTEVASRLNVSRRKLTFDDDYMDQLPPKAKAQEDCVHSSAEGHSITGEITGTEVTISYRCDKCHAVIRNFKAKDFSVKCTECRHSWKCTKLQFISHAEITIELPRGVKQTVVLSDTLLRSIVSFNTEGYCNTKQIEEKVLKVGNVRVDFENGHLRRVQRIAPN